MTNKLKVIDRTLGKGEIFVSKADNIRRIIIDDNYKNMLYDEKIKDYNLLRDRYLVFMYLGSGLAREKYSSTIFNLYREADYTDENLLDEIPSYRKGNSSDEEFNKGYQKALRNPLIIITEEGYLNNRVYEYNKESKEELDKNLLEEQKIGALIQKLETDARNNLMNKKEDVYKLKKTLK